VDADSPDQIIGVYSALVHALADPDQSVRNTAKEVAEEFEAAIGANSEDGDEAAATREATP
jgi:hypothetical protein